MASPSSPKTQAHSRPKTLKKFRFSHILSSLSHFFKWAHLYVQKQQNYVHSTTVAHAYSDIWHTPLMHNLYMHDLCTCVASQNHKKTSPKGPWVGPHHRAKTHHNVFLRMCMCVVICMCVCMCVCIMCVMCMCVMCIMCMCVCMLMCMYLLMCVCVVM